MLVGIGDGLVDQQGDRQRDPGLEQDTVGLNAKRDALVPVRPDSAQGFAKLFNDLRQIDRAAVFAFRVQQLMDGRKNAEPR